MQERALTAIGFVKKNEEIKDLLTGAYLFSIWHDIKSAHDSQSARETVTLAQLEVLQENLYQLRQRISIVDALLRETEPVIPSKPPPMY